MQYILTLFGAAGLEQSTLEARVQRQVVRSVLALNAFAAFLALPGSQHAPALFSLLLLDCGLLTASHQSARFAPAVLALRAISGLLLAPAMPLLYGAPYQSAVTIVGLQTIHWSVGLAGPALYHAPRWVALLLAAGRPHALRAAMSSGFFLVTLALLLVLLSPWTHFTIR